MNLLRMILSVKRQFFISQLKSILGRLHFVYWIDILGKRFIH
jgi:hypothetical protein